MKKILLLEEDIFLRLLYETEISDWGYSVHAAKNGQEALEMFSKENPDLVIMEMKLCNMNGFKVLREIMKLNSRTPVIINSASPNYFKSNFVRWATRDYIVKSSDLSELRASIEQIIGRRLQLSERKKVEPLEKSNGRAHFRGGL